MQSSRWDGGSGAPGKGDRHLAVKRGEALERGRRCRRRRRRGGGSGRVGGARERDDFLRSKSSKMRGRRRGWGRGRGRSGQGIRKTRVKKSSLEIRELLNWQRTGSPVRKGGLAPQGPVVRGSGLLFFVGSILAAGQANRPMQHLCRILLQWIYMQLRGYQSPAVQHERRTILRDRK